jgi:hypothetical protein
LEVKLNSNFEGGGGSIRREWKKSLNAVALVRNMYLLDKNKKDIIQPPMTRPGMEPGFGLHGNESHNAQKAGADHPLRVGSASLLLPALVNREWGCMQ